MFKSLTLAFLISSPLFLFSQTTSFEWARSTGGAGFDNGSGHCVDSEGNNYTVGYFNGACDLDPGPGEFIVSAVGGNDIFLQKLDAEGNFLWAKAFPGVSYSEGKAIALDHEDNLIITGFFDETVDLDPGDGVFSETSNGSTDIFVLKLDPTGEFVWAKTMGAAGLDLVRALRITPSGDILICGDFRNTVDFDPGESVYELTSEGSANYLLKLTNDGNFLWARAITGSGPSYAYNLEIDNTEAVYLTGYFFNTLDFDTGDDVLEKTAEGSDCYLVKHDKDGEFLWVKTISGPSNDVGFALKIGNSNNIYVAGSFAGTVDFDWGDGIETRTAEGTVDCFVQKLTLDGDFQWVRTFGGEGDDVVRALDIDPAGYVYTSGTYSGTADFDPSDSEFELSVIDYEDIFIHKMDANGEFKWAKSVGGISGNSLRFLNVDESGNIYVLGTYTETVDFDPETGPYNLTSAGSVDGFLLKLSQDVVSGLDKNSTTLFSVYPNPVLNTLHISSESTIQKINLYDLKGNVILHLDNLSSTSSTIDTEDLSKGIYIIEIWTDNGLHQAKILK